MRPRRTRLYCAAFLSSLCRSQRTVTQDSDQPGLGAVPVATMMNGRYLGVVPCGVSWRGLSPTPGGGPADGIPVGRPIGAPHSSGMVESAGGRGITIVLCVAGISTRYSDSNPLTTLAEPNRRNVRHISRLAVCLASSACSISCDTSRTDHMPISPLN